MKRAYLLILLLTSFFTDDSSAQPIRFLRADSIRVLVHGDTLNNPWAGGINTPLFSEVDLNGDGIHDLFMFDQINNRISTFINDGSPGVKAWHYAPEYVSKFPPVVIWAFLYDYNCDGKADFFTLAPSTSGMAVYRNDFDSAQGGLRFTLITSEMYETFYSPPNFRAPLFTSSTSVPTFGDVDGDGDMDILCSDNSTTGKVIFHKNHAVENSYPCDSLVFFWEDSNWGHFTVGINNSSIYATVGCFTCRPSGNIPEINKPDDDQSAAAQRDDTFFGLFMIDMNGDNAKDLLIGDAGALNSLLVMNSGSPDSAVMSSQDTLFPSSNIPAVFNNYHNHAYIDLDNDGVKDLIVEAAGFENYHDGIWFYKNTGTNSTPVFSFQSSSFLVDQMIDVGEGASPVLFDADGDGVEDLVIGNYGISDNSAGTYHSSLHLFRNAGTVFSPVFELVDSNYAGIGSLFLTGPLYPAFGDLNGDGNKDMILGEADGKLQYFINTGGVPANFSLTGVNFMSIDVGTTSTPQVIDLNRDGKLDIIAGAQSGRINYYENLGTTTSPFYLSVPTNDSLGGVLLHTNGSNGYSTPYFFSVNNNYKLLAGCSDGNVFLYDSIDGNLNGNFNRVDTIIRGNQGIRDKFNLAVSGGDLNNDGLTDMLLGIYGGGVSIYLQRDPHVGITTFSVPEINFALWPNPANEECAIRIFNSAGSSHKLNMINYLGQNVISKTFNGDSFSFSTREIPAGIYVLQLISAGNSCTRKLVVRH